MRGKRVLNWVDYEIRTAKGRFWFICKECGSDGGLSSSDKWAAARNADAHITHGFNSRVDA